MNEKNFPASIRPSRIRTPTQEIAAAIPTAAITSMSGDEKARTAAIFRSKESQVRFTCEKRSAS
jgi:hypothetical protein